MSQYGLGRGLDALIARKPAASSSSRKSVQSDSATADEVHEIPVTLITAGSYQPRQQFDEDQLRELAMSIREYGIIQPLVVCKHGDGYLLIAGERRLRAAKMNGMTVVPVVLRGDDEHERLAVALIENIQRVDLNSIEMALAYKQLLDEFSLTYEELARRLGKSRPVISNTVRLLNLHPEIQDAVRSGFLSYGQARSLCAITNHDDQIRAFREVQDRGIKKSEIESLTREITQKKYVPRTNMDPSLRDKETILRDYFGTRVNIIKRKKGGLVQIEFYSDEDLRGILGKIIQ